jgi:hypothetical protein
MKERDSSKAVFWARRGIKCESHSAFRIDAEHVVFGISNKDQAKYDKKVRFIRAASSYDLYGPHTIRFIIFYKCSSNMASKPPGNVLIYILD